MATIIIDPLTRVEGHLKVKVDLDANNRVVAANVTGNLYRDFENILRGRHPWDAVHITQRICGVCPVSHAIASTKANEQALGFTPNDQAILRRALIQGGDFIQSHILHFYHLNLMDYIVGPQMPPWTPGYSSDMRMSSANSDRLRNNYLEALQVRRQAQEMVAILAGKMPHVASITPGGVTMSPNSSQITQFSNYLNTVRSFINNKYLPDVDLLASAYNDYFNIGRGPGNLISFGVFDQPGGTMLFRSGRIEGGISGSVDFSRITEHVRHSYYSSTSKLNPASGVTTPSFGKSGAYSWLKSPRYDGKVYEAGPLARMRVNGDYTGGVSVMDRIRARALETKKIADAMSGWLSNVTAGTSAFTKRSPNSSGSRAGLTEAPRGALGHWLQYSDTKITRYQVVTPTSWNASPRDDNGVAGAMEQALIGTQVADPAQPVELLRIVHSFDPCTSCSVHVINPEKGIDKEFVAAHPAAPRN
jgi:hydrogenase large subunit